MVRIIRKFKAIGYRNEELQELRNDCPYTLERSAAFYFDDGEAEYFVEFTDNTEEQYTL